MTLSDFIRDQSKVQRLAIQIFSAAIIVALSFGLVLFCNEAQAADTAKGEVIQAEAKCIRRMARRALRLKKQRKRKALRRLRRKIRAAKKAEESSFMSVAETGSRCVEYCWNGMEQETYCCSWEAYNYAGSGGAYEDGDNDDYPEPPWDYLIPPY